MGNPCRCPVCNTFGSSRLNGYCKKHVPNVKTVNEINIENEKFEANEGAGPDQGYMIRKNYMNGYGAVPRSSAFIGSQYPTLKRTYGLQEKGGNKK
jgi:hypothetical protein